MSIKLELRKRTDGQGLVICVCGSQNQIVIPLAKGVSMAIEKMARAEGVKQEKLILPPTFKGNLNV